MPSWDRWQDNQRYLSDAAKEQFYEDMVPPLRWPDSMSGRQIGSALLGPMKQKPVDWKWWVTGSAQILLWIDDRRGGRDRQGKGAWQRSKGKGKGSGQ